METQYKMLVCRSRERSSVIFVITQKMLNRLQFNDKLRSGMYRIHKFCKVVNNISDSDLYDIGQKIMTKKACKGDLSMVEVNQENAFSTYDSINYF